MSVIGITGGSGSGKSTLAAALRDSLGPERCVLLPQDAYYRDLSHRSMDERVGTNFDAPDAVELDLLALHLIALAEGEAIRPPIYDMTTHTRRGMAPPVGPAGHVIVEGLFLTANAAVAGAIDVLVFVDLPDDVRLARRIARDVTERGRTEAEVRGRWSTHARPMHERWVAPAESRADVIVRGDAPVAGSVEAVRGRVR